MGRLRKWLASLIKRPCQIPIPFLPDELLVKIFEYIPPESRPPLRLTCKRFRDLERTIGNRTLDFVGVVMYSDHVEIVGKTCYKHCYLFETKADEEFEVAIPDISKFFKGATAKVINFQVDKDCEPNPSHALLSLLNLIATEDISFFLYCKSDFSGFLISFFENYKNENLKVISFDWHSLKHQNLTRLQEAMMLLPKLEYVYLFEERDNMSDVDKEHFLLNGPLMLAMIRTAPEISLDSIDCTLEDLLVAFEIICESGIHKNIKMFVVRSAVDDLVTVAKELDFVVNRNTIIDYPRGYEITVDHDSRDASNRCCRVWINPISERNMKEWKKFLVDIGQGTAWNPHVLNPLLEKAAVRMRKTMK